MGVMRVGIEIEMVDRVGKRSYEVVAGVDNGYRS